VFDPDWFSRLKAQAAHDGAVVSGDTLRAAIQEIERHRTTGLAAMLRAQRELQIKSFDLDPSELEDGSRMEFIRWNVLALIAEMVEYLDETGWKPWATSQHVNAEEALGELVDAWHFFMNILWATEGGGLLGDADVLVEVFTGRYFKKREVNAQRQADGYDGVTGKCPNCHRDRKETQLANVTGDVRTVYCPCGHVWETVQL
jgi:dimeric dUTPase (all-alpha-NTP-PPase superfamily)